MSVTNRTNARHHTLTLPWVEQATQGFVFCDDMRVAVSLALAAGVNLIFSGPGGHAKSEFLEAVFSAIAGQEPYIKSFGQGTGTEELFGGIDFDALNRAEGAMLRFNPELSFLTHPIAVFEELFDAPPRVLTSLKDALTARELRNGHQRFPMTTRVIAAATNHSPQEIAEGGPEIEALIQRFPIQLEVRWERYDRQSFNQLFAAVLGREDAGIQGTTWTDVEALQQQAGSAAAGSGIRSMLSQILVELRKDGVSISPRTAIMALQLARAAAAINGRDRVIPNDLRAIAFLPGALHLRRRIDELIEDLRGSIEAEEKLDQAEREIAELAARYNVSTSPEDLQAVARAADGLAVYVSNIRVSADQMKRRQMLFTSAQSLATEASNHESRRALDDAEAVLRSLEGRLDEANTIAEWTAFRDNVRELLNHLISRPVSGVHANNRYNGLINDAQALVQLAEDGLKNARLEASVDENIQLLDELGAEISRLARQLDRRGKPQGERDALMRRVGEIESELGRMLVHPSLKATYDGVMSKVKVIRLNSRSGTQRV